MESNQINLLWTGGWDSSFRLLRLLIVEEKQVQPFYIFDTARKSLAWELDAMQIIKKQLKTSFPDAAVRLSETYYIHKNDLDITQELKGYFKQLTDRYHIGSQYLWLSAFSKSYHIDKLELSIEKDNFQNTWMEQLIPYFIHDGQGYVLDENQSFDEKLELFTNFRFPLLDIDKFTMEIFAKRNNFRDLMRNTWFCHNPILNQPCGICRPCQLAFKGNLSHQNKMANILLRSSFRMLRYLKVKGQFINL